MPSYEKNKKHIIKHLEKIDRLYITVPKGTKEIWQRKAAESGRSLNEFVSACVEAAADDMIPLGPPRRMKEEKADNIIQLP